MGMLELGVTFSFAQLLIDDEIASMVKRVVQGITVNDETLAVDIIKNVGAGKDFLGQRHTRDFMAREQSKPKLIDRRMRGAWSSRGGKSMAERANDKAIEILENHKPVPLPEDVQKRFREIIERAESEHGV
ncbi:MAG: hypothetical protein CVV34_01140 [Methanomicrobiales archaeon HGW-Methanomicrobiales-5]|nr:MAG: hypothetical protein CVV34_01140 [Methanomicrobiales archaeon HGW-Methanomicrobiales-5]